MDRWLDMSCLVRDVFRARYVHYTTLWRSFELVFRICSSEILKKTAMATFREIHEKPGPPLNAKIQEDVRGMAWTSWMFSSSSRFCKRRFRFEHDASSRQLHQPRPRRNGIFFAQTVPGVEPADAHSRPRRL